MDSSFMCLRDRGQKLLLFRILLTLLFSMTFNNAVGSSYYYDAKGSRHLIGEYESTVISGVTWYYQTFLNGSAISANIVAGGVKYAGDLTVPWCVEEIFDTSGKSQGLIYVTQIANSAFSGCD